jgi:two-component system, chemotaxis family, chemotaxis protein CheY
MIMNISYVYKILIVSNDEAVTKSFEKVLNGSLTKLFFANNATEGLWKASNDEFNLIVSSHKLDIGDGISLFKKIPTLPTFREDQKFVLVSEQLTREDLEVLGALKVKALLRPLKGQDIVKILSVLKVPLSLPA